MMMHDYLVRQGYLPIVIRGLVRGDYIDMIRAAQEGRPDEFVGTVLRTQLEELQGLQSR